MGCAHGGRRRFRALRARGGRLRRWAKARAPAVGHRELNYLDLDNADPGHYRYLLRYRVWTRAVPIRSASARSHSTRPSPTARARSPSSRADVTNGQDVVVFAPRRYGKSSLMWRVAQELVRRRVLVASVDLMTTPTVGEAGREARAHDPRGHRLQEEKALDRLRIFRSLRIAPIVNVDPDSGRLSFGFDASHRPEDLRATLEHLLALPGELGAERGRRVALDPRRVPGGRRHRPGPAAADARGLPGPARGGARVPRQQAPHDAPPVQRRERALLAQRQADRVRRHRARALRRYIVERFRASGRAIEPRRLEAVLHTTGGHPYATQELCYFLWQLTPEGEAADLARLEAALDGVLRSESAHFATVWDHALGAAAPAAAGAGRRARPCADHRLPAPPRPALAVDRAERRDRARATGAGGQRARRRADRRTLPLGVGPHALRRVVGRRPRRCASFRSRGRRRSRRRSQPGCPRGRRRSTLREARALSVAAPSSSSSSSPARRITIWFSSIVTLTGRWPAQCSA